MGNDIRLPGSDEELCRAIADKPGRIECEAGRALRFAQEHAADFELVIRIDGRARTLPSVGAEIGRRVGQARRILIATRGSGSDARGRHRATTLRVDLDEAAFDRALQSSEDPDFIWPAVSWLERNERWMEAIAALNGILQSRPQLTHLARERFWIQERLRIPADPNVPVSPAVLQPHLPFDQR